MTKLIITVGAPGAGKSTWADTLPTSYLRLERDRFREALFGSRRAYHDSWLKAEYRSALITKSMLEPMKMWPAHLPVVLSDTGLHHRSVAPFIRVANRRNLKVVVHVFDTPQHLVVERNQTRPIDQRVPHYFLEQAFRALEDPKAWWREFPRHDRT